jgi:hypothetical protein
MSSAEVVAQMVVPNAPPGTNINCTSCANAVYDCLTGLNADATAGDNTGCGNQFSLEAAHFSNSGTVSEVTDYMESLGSGQTRIVTIQTGPNTSRALDVTNQNGTVYFIDGQSGQIVTPSPGVGIRLGYPSYNDPPVPWDK